jgi:hypothetical protein
MNWLAFFQNVGSFGIASGLLAWLIKSVVSQSLARELEIFKAQLSKAQAVELQESANRFTLGATSHMASVAFDKHIEFCERYMKETSGTLTTLFREGPTKLAMGHANSLARIRGEYTLWLTPEIETELGKFEKALREMGSHERIASDYPGLEGHGERVNKMYTIFAQIMGEKEWAGEKLSDELAVTKVVIGTLQRVLGIPALTEIRTKLVERALSNLNADKTAGFSPG